jgi:hypothetical protein
VSNKANTVPLKPNPKALIWVSDELGEQALLDAYPDLAGADMLWGLPYYDDRQLVGYEVMGVFLPTGGPIEPLFQDEETRKWQAMIEFWLAPKQDMTAWEALFYGGPAKPKGGPLK